MQTLIFNKTKQQIEIHILSDEYDLIERVAKTKYKNTRSVNSVLKYYALLKIYSVLFPQDRFISIQSSVFRETVSSNNYTEYRDLLYCNNIIEYKRSKVKKVDNRYESDSMKYSLKVMSYMYSKDIFQHYSDKRYVIRLDFPTHIFNSLLQKKPVAECYNEKKSKVNNIVALSDRDCYITTLIADLIRDIVNEKFKSKSTYRRRLNKITKQLQPYKHNYDIETIIVRVLKNISEIKINKKIEQIVNSLFSKKFANQYIIQCHNDSGILDSELCYYSDLSIDLYALNYCCSLNDLRAIADLDKIPAYNTKDKKLYSTLSRLKRILRKYVRYNNELLYEATDIKSAHFTMIPKIFKMLNIQIDTDEMNRYKAVTQTKDIYNEVIANSNISREDIKSVFQSFFSIKNEKQYLHDRSDSYYRSLICDYFKTNFSNIYKALIDFHKYHKKDTLKSYANIVESDIMNSLCRELRKQQMHPFRIHDAIYLIQSEIDSLSIDINQYIYDKINS